MRSTGEVMGIDYDFGAAFMKSQIAAGQNLPLKGSIFVSVNNHDKRAIVYIVKKLADLGFSIVATAGTGGVLKKNGVDCKIVHKLGEGKSDILELVDKGKVSLLINTPGDKKAKNDEAKIRSAAVMHNIPLITTISGAQATVNGIEAAKKKGFEVKALQDYFSPSIR